MIFSSYKNISLILIYLQSDIQYLVLDLKALVSVLPCHAGAVFVSPPLVRSLVVTELLYGCSSSLLSSIFLSKVCIHCLASSSFGFLSPLLITAQMSFPHAHSPHHHEQPYSKAVCASVVNTSPFFDKFCWIPFFKTSGCPKTGFSRERWNICFSSVTGTRLSLYPPPPSSPPFLSPPSPPLQYQGGYPSPHCWLWTC